MILNRARQGGLTLIELVTILVLVGILAVTSLPRILPSDTFQLQASRDSIITALFSAQQLAMTQDENVQVSFFSSGNRFQVDVRIDGNGNGSFETSESTDVTGVDYPISLEPNQSITATSIIFDKLGEPNSATNLTLSQSGKSVIVSVSPTGYAF